MKQKIQAWVLKQRNKFGNWLFKLAKKVYVAEKKTKFVRKKVKGAACLVLFLGFMAGCTRQVPVQTTINYTDNSQMTQVAGDGNHLAATSDITSQQSAAPEQKTEAKSGGLFWLFMLGMLSGIILSAAGVAAYFYVKKKYKFWN